MKTSKMLGAVALTAALAMGTMPAFAAGLTDPQDPNVPPTQGVGADERVGNISDDKTMGTGDTTVWGKSYIAQLNVTIPIEMGVALPSTDGAIIFPKADAYRIKNNGSDSVKIVNVVGMNTQDFVIADDAANASSMTAPNAPAYAGVSMNLTVPGKNSVSLAKNEADTPLNWIISKESEIKVAFDGKCKWATGVADPSFNNQVMKVTTLAYTVSTETA